MSSHRVSADAPLVRHGDAQAVVRAALRRGDRELLVEIEINPGRANRVRVNRAPLPRPRELLGLVRTVLFAPEDLALVRGDPTERRRFLDELLVTRTPAAGRRAGRLRPGAQAAQRPAEDRPAGPRQGDRDPRRLGRPPHRPRRAAAGRPAAADRRPRPAHGAGPTPASPAEARRSAGLGYSSTVRRPGTAPRSRPGPRPLGGGADRGHARAGGRAARGRAGPRDDAGRPAPRRPGHPPRARRRPRGSPATGSPGRWRSRSSWPRSPS